MYLYVPYYLLVYVSAETPLINSINVWPTIKLLTYTRTVYSAEKFIILFQSRLIKSILLCNHFHSQISSKLKCSSPSNK